MIGAGKKQAVILSFAMLIALVLPASSSAAVLAFRNDTNSAVIVQVMSLVNNVPRRRVQVVMPGKSYIEPATPGNKQVIIADARQPALILFNEVIAPAMKDQFFAIRPESPMPTGRQATFRQLRPSVRLVPTEAPAKTPSATSPPPRRPPARQP